jgi:hypothetical protein
MRADDPMNIGNGGTTMQVRALVSAMAVFLSMACGNQERVLAPGAPATPRVSATHQTLPCDISWASPVSGDWLDGTNWDAGRVPYSWEVVCIVEPGSYTVTMTWGLANTLYVGDGLSSIRVGIVGPGTPASYPDFDASALVVRHNAYVAMSSGARVRLSSLEVDGTFVIEGDNEIDGIEVGDGALFMTAGPTTLLALNDFEVAGTVLVAAGRDLVLKLGTGVIDQARFDDGATVTGDGAIYINAVPGSLPTVEWAGATLGTRVGNPTLPIVTARGTRLRLRNSDEAYGVIDIDPSGDSIEISGIIGPNAHVRVRRAQWASVEPVNLDGVINEGRLEFLSSLSSATEVTGGMVNRGTITVSTGRLDLDLDSLKNEGTILVTDSTRLLRGRLTNAGSVRLSGGAADLVIAGGDFFAESTGSFTGRLAIEAGGRLGGTGTLDRVEALGGVVNPGIPSAPLGDLTFNVLTLNAASRMVVELAGTTPSTIDRLHVLNSLTLAGTLDVRSVAPFVGGVCGEIVRPITNARTATRTGTFSQYAGTKIGPHNRWRVNANATAVELIGYDPSVVLSLSPTAIAGSEGGQGGTIDLCLGGNGPVADVTVNATSRFGQSTTTPNPTSFTTANWMLPQQLKVTAIDDAVAEPTHVDSIRFRLTSTDQAYTGIAATQLQHTITDNDLGADLAVSLVSSPAAVTVNQQFEARYRVTNNGPASSSGSTFTISPMSGITYVGSTAQVTCTTSAGVVTCAVGALAAGASVEFVLVYRGSTSGSHANTVRITGAEYDPVVGNDSFVWNLTVN